MIAGIEDMTAGEGAMIIGVAIYIAKTGFDYLISRNKKIEEAKIKSEKKKEASLEDMQRDTIGRYETQVKKMDERIDSLQGFQESTLVDLATDCKVALNTNNKILDAATKTIEKTHTFKCKADDE